MAAGSLALPVALIGVAFGVLAADTVALPVLPPLWTGMTVFVIGAGSRSRAALLLGVSLIAFGAGAWRGSSGALESPGRPSVAILAGGGEHELVGTVIDEPRPRADRLQIVIGDVLAGADAEPVALADRLLVWVPRGLDARSGDRLHLRSRIDLPEDFDGFAYREYLARQGVAAIARARAAEVVGHATGPASVLAGARAALLGGLNDLVPEPEAALGAGILLGVRASIAPEINDAFATAGLTHVVAISGWNIAIVAALVAVMVRPLSRRPGGRWTTALAATVTIGAYVVLTGASPSVVRAALMAAAMLVARLGGSRPHAASALALAALLMLLAAPAVLWDVGFQLSLLATGGLIWFGGPVERRLAGWPAWIREPVALTMAAQLTTLPVILVNFERLSLVAPVANVLVVPFVPLAMLFCAISSLVGWLDDIVDPPLLGSVLGWFAGGAAWLTLRVMVALGSALASVPHAALEVTVPPAVAAVWLPLLGLANWAVRQPPASGEPTTVNGAPAPSGRARRLLRPLPTAIGLVLVLIAITVASRPDGKLYVTALNVGQGDAILVEAPGGRTMLVDGGPDPELTLRRLGANLPFFFRRIDLVILSHPHQDHIAGLVEVLERFEVGAVLHAGIAYDNASYDRLLVDAARAGVRLALARSGQRLALDATTSVQVLYPTEQDAARPLPDGDINNGSVVLLVAHGGFSALLTGDAEAPIESVLASRGVLRPVDMLKVAHHGSASSTTPRLLEATRPSIAVISAGEDNDYGHPAPQTLAALAAVPVAVLRTDLEGDVEVVTDGETFRVRTDAGWSASRPVHGRQAAGSIGRWPFPTDPPPVACSSTSGCPAGSSSIPRAWPGSPWPQPASSRRRRSRSMAGSWRRRRCCTTSTRWRSVAPAGSTASSARAGWRRWATRSSPCRSPPIRSRASCTMTGFRSAGPRCWWPWPTATWARSS